MKKFKVSDKVFVIATDEQLSQIQMNSPKVNKNLRKYESTITEELVKGKFEDSEGNKHSVFILDGTFAIPGIYLKHANQKDNVKEIETFDELKPEGEEELKDEDVVNESLDTNTEENEENY